MGAPPLEQQWQHTHHDRRRRGPEQRVRGWIHERSAQHRRVDEHHDNGGKDGFVLNVRCAVRHVHRVRADQGGRRPWINRCSASRSAPTATRSRSPASPRVMSSSIRSRPRLRRSPGTCPTTRLSEASRSVPTPVPAPRSSATPRCRAASASPTGTPPSTAYFAGTFAGTVDLTGAAPVTNTSGTDVFLARLAPSMSVASTTAYLVADGGEVQEVWSVATDTTGNVFMAGALTGIAHLDKQPDTLQVKSHGGKDAYVAKLDANLKPTWIVPYGDGKDQDGARGGGLQGWGRVRGRALPGQDRFRQQARVLDHQHQGRHLHRQAGALSERMTMTTLEPGTVIVGKYRLDRALARGAWARSGSRGTSSSTLPSRSSSWTRAMPDRRRRAYASSGRRRLAPGSRARTSSRYMIMVSSAKLLLSSWSSSMVKISALACRRPPLAHDRHPIALQIGEGFALRARGGNHSPRSQAGQHILVSPSG